MTTLLHRVILTLHPLGPLVVMSRTNPQMRTRKTTNMALCLTNHPCPDHQSRPGESRPHRHQRQEANVLQRRTTGRSQSLCRLPVPHPRRNTRLKTRPYRDFPPCRSTYLSVGLTVKVSKALRQPPNARHHSPNQFLLLPLHGSRDGDPSTSRGRLRRPLFRQATLNNRQSRTTRETSRQPLPPCALLALSTWETSCTQSPDSN